MPAVLYNTSRKDFGRPTILLLSALLSCLCFTALLTPSSARAAEENSLINFKIGDRLPSFWEAALGRTEQVAFQPGQGKPAVLLFFRLNPHFRELQIIGILEGLSRLASTYGEAVDFLSFYSGDKDKKELLEQLIRDQVVTIPVLDDTTQEAYRTYGVFMMPLAILVTKTGELHEIIPATGEFVELVDKHVHFLLGKWSKEELQEALAPPETVVRSKEEKEYIRRVNYGRVMYARKMYSSAAREFLTASKMQPQPVEAYIGLGYVHLMTRKWEKAQECFQYAREIDENSDEALAGLGLALHGEGNWEAARPILESALIAKEPAIELIIALAEIYESKGEIIKAIKLNKLAVSRLMERL